MTPSYIPTQGQGVTPSKARPSVASTERTDNNVSKVDDFFKLSKQREPNTKLTELTEHVEPTQKVIESTSEPNFVVEVEMVTGTNK